MGFLKDIFGFSKNEDMPKQTIRVGAYLVLRGTKLYNNSYNNEHEKVVLGKYYLYSTEPTNGRYPVSDSFIGCGKLPTTLHIKGWLEEDDMKKALQ